MKVNGLGFGKGRFAAVNTQVGHIAGYGIFYKNCLAFRFGNRLAFGGQVGDEYLFEYPFFFVLFHLRGQK